MFCAKLPFSQIRSQIVNKMRTSSWFCIGFLIGVYCTGDLLLRGNPLDAPSFKKKQNFVQYILHAYFNSKAMAILSFPQVDTTLYRSGDVVRVMDDRGEVSKLQKGHGEWNDSMSMVKFHMS